jgi:hypothetical protein
MSTWWKINSHNAFKNAGLLNSVASQNRQTGILTPEIITWVSKHYAP